MPVDYKKQIEFGPEARAELMKGIDILADAVVCTLGQFIIRMIIFKKINGSHHAFKRYFFF